MFQHLQTSMPCSLSTINHIIRKLLSIICLIGSQLALAYLVLLLHGFHHISMIGLKLFASDQPSLIPSNQPSLIYQHVILVFRKVKSYALFFSPSSFLKLSNLFLTSESLTSNMQMMCSRRFYSSYLTQLQLLRALNLACLITLLALPQRTVPKSGQIRGNHIWHLPMAVHIPSHIIC